MDPARPWAASKVPTGVSAVNLWGFSPGFNTVSVVGVTRPATGKITVEDTEPRMRERPAVGVGTPAIPPPYTLSSKFRSISPGGSGVR